MKNTRGSEFKTLYRLVDNKVEASEFFISKEAKYTSIPLKDLKIKKLIDKTNKAMYNIDK